MGTPEEWADRLAQRQEEKRTIHQSHDVEAAKVRKLIAEKFPLLWEELMVAFDEYCKAYNDRLKPERILYLIKELDRFEIKEDARGQMVGARIEREANRILIGTYLSKERYRAGVGMRDDGIVHLSSETNGKTYTPAEIAEKTLTPLLYK
jgi:hypothetical protein